jgi:hypothetical protein
MEALEWIPISPVLKKNESFQALCHLRNADTLTTIPLGNEEEYSVFPVNQQEVKTKITVNLGQYSFLELDTTANISNFLYEAAIYSSTTVDNLIGGIIYGTRNGTGYRLIPKATKLDIDANISVASIAAQATLENASVQFKLNGFGFPNNASILANVPTTASFNVGTWVNASDYNSAVQDYLSGNISSLVPRPYLILANPTHLIDKKYELQSCLFFSAGLREELPKRGVTPGKKQL